MESGANIAKQPMIHTEIELGPAAAAVATHCRFDPAMTKKSATSTRPSVLRSGGSSSSGWVTFTPYSFWAALPS